MTKQIWSKLTAWLCCAALLISFAPAGLNSAVAVETAAGSDTTESGMDLSSTVFLIGVIGREEADSYGNKATTFFARGVDMNGNEVLVPIGYQKQTGNLFGADTIDEQSFYSVEENDDSKETRELGLKKIVAVNPNWSNEEPVAVKFMFHYGADWQPGGRFEHGVSYVYSGSSSFAYTDPAGKTLSTVSQVTENSRFLLLAGEPTQDYPLETEITTGNFSLSLGATTDIYAILTRSNGGLWNVEAMVVPVPNLDYGKNKTMIYAPRATEAADGRVEWSTLTPVRSNAAGNVFEVYSALTGEPIEVTLRKEITSLPSGYYSVDYDSEAKRYNIAVDDSGVPYQVPQGNITQLRNTYDSSDGRYREGVAYDQTLTAMSGSTIYTETFGASTIPISTYSATSAVKVVDIRSDEAIAISGLSEITSLKQVWELQEACGAFVDFELDMTWQSGKVTTVFVEPYNNAAYGVDTLVYGFDYGADEVTVVTGKMHATGDVIDLPRGVTVARPGFYYLTTGANGMVGLLPTTLDGVAGVAFDASELPACDTLLNAAAVDNFNAYDVIEYQLLTVDGTDILVIMGAGNEAESGVTAKALIDAADFGSVVDTTDSGITLANLNAKQSTMCMVYTAYDMINGNKLLVINEVDAGTQIDKDNLNEVASATVINNTNADFHSLAELKSLAASGYIVAAKLYEVEGETLLVVSQCMNGNVVAGTLTFADFNKGFVKLTGDASVGSGLTVAGNWIIDLNGYTLTGTAAPYFTVGANTSLTIQDSGSTGTIQGLEESTEAMIRVKSGGTINLEGGTLTGHTNVGSNGGAIGVRDGDAGALVNISGGAIINNVAKRGGGISVGDGGNSDLIITGGTISGNSATDFVNYGGVYSHTGTFTITGGTIEDPFYWRYSTEGNSISGNPVISDLCFDAITTATIGNLLPGANVTTNMADYLTVTDATVQHTAGTRNYTYASDLLNIKVQQPAEGGTIKVSAASALKGSTITVTATPEIGYELVAIYVDGKAIDGNTFVVTRDHKVTAEFAMIDYNVNLEIEGEGEVTLSAEYANTGDVITVTPAPAAGKEVYDVKVNGKSLPGDAYEFVMPAEDVTVEVIFGDIQYAITKGAVTGGTVTVADKAVAGETVTITATAKTGYCTGAITVTGASSANVPVADGTFTMPAEAVTVSVEFIKGVSYAFATVSDLPTNYKVEANDFGVTTANIEAKLAENDIHFTIFGSVVVIDYFSVGKSVPLSQTGGMLASGSYVLEGDHVLTNVLNIRSGDVVIDLAGHTISMPDREAVYFNIAAGSKLTIRDSVGGGKVQFKNTANGSPGVMITGTFVLEGGELTGWTRINNGTYGAGGMIYLYNGATFNMTGGKLTGANCANASPLRASDGNATIIITGGEISGNNGQIGPVLNIGKAGLTSHVTIGGDAVISGNTYAGREPKLTENTIQMQDCIVTIEGNAQINGTMQVFKGSATSEAHFSGAPVVKYFRIDSATKTTVTISNLEAGASITTSYGMTVDAANLDGTVKVTPWDDTATGGGRATGNVYTFSGPSSGGVTPSRKVIASGYCGGEGDITITGGDVSGLRLSKDTAAISGNPESGEAGEGGTVAAAAVEEPVKQRITVGKIEHGAVLVNPVSGTEGTGVTVYSASSEGFELETILVDGEAIDGNTFTITGNHVVTASFVCSSCVPVIGEDLGDGTHAIVCRYCGTVQAMREHVYQNGVCGCGATESVEPDNPNADVSARFVLTGGMVRPGDTIHVELFLSSSVPVNSIALSGIAYDTDVLTFTGFSDYEHMEELTVLPPTFDEDKGAIVIGLRQAQEFDGKICSLDFTVNETASNCDISIKGTSIVKNGSTVVASAVVPATVLVRQYLPGDINGDDVVTLEDAVLLFNCSMLPDLYPIDYPGDMDFDGDGDVDLDDAVYLFNYSMLPDLYPLQ